MVQLTWWLREIMAVKLVTLREEWLDVVAGQAPSPLVIQLLTSAMLKPVLKL